MPQLMLMSMKNSVKMSSFYRNNIVSIDVDVREASSAIAAQSARCGTASPSIHRAGYYVEMIPPLGSSSTVSMSYLPCSSSSSSTSVPRFFCGNNTSIRLFMLSISGIPSRPFFFCVCGIFLYILRGIL